ncbi:MAG: antitoxin Xre/MbcA/ParS toxin-binding domain-containing protein [Sphingomicrobium sp.]
MTKAAAKPVRVINPNRPLRKGGFEYVDLFRAGRNERILIIKTGLQASEAKRILAGLSLPKGETMRALNLSVATFNRKVAQHQALGPEETERVLGVAKLVGQVQAMVEESGNAEGFNAEKWVSQWLREPIPALDGQRPIDLLDTMEGQALVSETLARMQSGAYA